MIALAITVGLAVFVIVALADRPEPSSEGLLVLSAAEKVSAAVTEKMPRPDGSKHIGQDEVARSDPDAALLDDRFNAAVADSASTSRAERLQARIRRMMHDGTQFSDVTAQCRKGVCRLSGKVVSGRAAADRASAFALLHHEEFVAIGAAERLEPGPVAIAATDPGEMRFVAYLIDP